VTTGLKNTMTTYALTALTLGNGLRPCWKRVKIAFDHDTSADPECHAHRWEFDSVHGRGRRHQRGTTARSPRCTRIPVGQHQVDQGRRWDGVDVVIDCTGALRPEASCPLFPRRVLKRFVVSAAVKEANAKTSSMGERRTMTRSHRSSYRPRARPTALRRGQVLMEAIGYKQWVQFTIS